MIHEKVFKERLHVLIGERGIELFSRRCGISEKKIQQYLSGDCLPTLRCLESISAKNGVSIGWLIGEELHPCLAQKESGHHPSRSMQDIAQWISAQSDGINYWEVLKARLAQEFPEFKKWLSENNA